jgi:hypothetical protein
VIPLPGTDLPTQAAFHFSFLPFTVPYPVPFRILGDERKGWVDVTYVSQVSRCTDAARVCGSHVKRVP